MFNKDNIDTLKGSEISYKTIKNGNICKFTIEGIDSVKENFATVKVIENKKLVFKTLHFANITLGHSE
jgi:hypothetical protein